MHSELPLISCIMPTRGRPEFFDRAILNYSEQRWNTELIIVDDEDAQSFIEVPPWTFLFGCPGMGFSYTRVAGCQSIAAKRNIAISRARGDIIAHWDDDDWSDPERLMQQYAFLESYGAAIVGYHSMAFTDGTRWWKYSGAPGYALGTSLMYRRSFWQQNPFPPEANVGEDNWFVGRAGPRLVSVDAGGMMFARVHPGNTSQKLRDIENPANARQWAEIECPPEFAEVTA